MSVTIHGNAKATIALDGKSLDLDEEALALTWSFGARNGDFGEWVNFLKWLTEQFGQAKSLADPQPGKGDAEAEHGTVDQLTGYSGDTHADTFLRFTMNRGRRITIPAERIMETWNEHQRCKSKIETLQGELDAANQAQPANPKTTEGGSQTGMSVRERLIRTAYCFSSQGDAEAARYLMGVIDTIRCDRDRLREHFQGPQTSEPETEAGSQPKQNANEAKR